MPLVPRRFQPIASAAGPCRRQLPVPCDSSYKYSRGCFELHSLAMRTKTGQCPAESIAEAFVPNICQAGKSSKRRHSDYSMHAGAYSTGPGVKMRCPLERKCFKNQQFSVDTSSLSLPAPRIYRTQPKCRAKARKVCPARVPRAPWETRRETRRSPSLGQRAQGCSFRSGVSTACSRCRACELVACELQTCVAVVILIQLGIPLTGIAPAL